MRQAHEICRASKTGNGREGGTESDEEAGNQAGEGRAVFIEVGKAAG